MRFPPTIGFQTFFSKCGDHELQIQTCNSTASQRIFPEFLSFLKLQLGYVVSHRAYTGPTGKMVPCYLPYLFEVVQCSILVYLSAMNADVQGTAKWIELNQTGNSCASVQSAFPAAVASYAMFLNLSCALDIATQQQLSFQGLG